MLFCPALLYKLHIVIVIVTDTGLKTGEYVNEKGYFRQFCVSKILFLS